ncbi:MAG: SEC-C domain-containing protein [Bacteroidales bacterium]|nr:SEC-C domain-containing protein [Bacteroidales bacterium]
MITKQIEKAQKKVEENHFGVRKHLLDYDDVMNMQRKAIYEKRRHALFGERLEIDINNMLYDLGESLITKHQDDESFDDLKLDVLANMGVEVPFDENEFKHGKTDDLADKLYEKALESYNRKMQLVGEKTLPVIKDIYEKQPGLKYILIPFTDGKKGINVSVNIEKAVQNGAHEISLSLEKFITLAMIDDAWVEHLREIDDLKQAVQNSAHYEQKDPLVIYKMESYNLFESMILKMNADVISFLMLSNLPAPDPNNARAQRARAVDRTKLKEQRSDLLSKANTNTQENQVTQPIHVEKKVGRNDPCPCGSGKKYKNCHGRLE